MASTVKNPKVYNPDETDYAVRPKDAHHRSKAEILGFEESLLVPQADPRMARQPRSLKALKKWRPTRMRFWKPWPEDELPDAWFELLAFDLWMKTKAFTTKYFEFDDIQENSGDSPWLSGFSEEFVSYISMVARQDKNRGGWDGLLEEKATRVQLVMGVIGKVLEINVFDKLLFGADNILEDLFKAQDLGTVEIEGYRRTNLRGHTVRTCLPEEILPPNYWPAVDALTMRLLVLLLPMLNLMDKHFADSRANSLRVVHQDLHHIVAEAGYLSIAIRRSRTVFRFDTPLLGNQWEFDQHNADNDLYMASKEAATLEAGLAATDPPSLVAKVQIVQWPQLQRWKALGNLDAQDEEDGMGETVSMIMHSKVVYYAGGVSDAADAVEDVPTLAQYVRTRRARRSLRRALDIALVSLVVITFLGAGAAWLKNMRPAVWGKLRLHAQGLLQDAQDWGIDAWAKLLSGGQHWGWEVTKSCWDLVLVAYAFILSWLVYLWNTALGKDGGNEEVVAPAIGLKGTLLAWL